MDRDGDERKCLLALGSRVSALLGLLCLVPFIAANTIVANRIEPILVFIRPDGHTSAIEVAILGLCLFSILVGAIIAAWPIFRRNGGRGRPWLLLNGAVATLMFVVFAGLVLALGSEIYRCDVLQIPNCD